MNNNRRIALNTNKNIVVEFTDERIIPAGGLAVVFEHGDSGARDKRCFPAGNVQGDMRIVCETRFEVERILGTTRGVGKFDFVCGHRGAGFRFRSRR